MKHTDKRICDERRDETSYTQTCMTDAHIFCAHKVFTVSGIRVC
jgi:hypothetical protein